MAYKLQKVGNSTNFPYEFSVCDSIDELPPVDQTIIFSKVLVLSTGDTYILNSSK